MKSSSVQRRVRDSSGGSEGSEILVVFELENTWLRGYSIYTIEVDRICNGEMELSNRNR